MSKKKSFPPGKKNTPRFNFLTPTTTTYARKFTERPKRLLLFILFLFFFPLSIGLPRDWTGLSPAPADRGEQLHLWWDLPVPVGGLQGLREAILFQLMAGEARAHARREVRIRMHCQRMQAKVQLSGEKKKEKNQKR